MYPTRVPPLPMCDDLGLAMHADVQCTSLPVSCTMHHAPCVIHHSRPMSINPDTSKQYGRDFPAGESARRSTLPKGGSRMLVVRQRATRPFLPLPLSRGGRLQPGLLGLR